MKEVPILDQQEQARRRAENRAIRVANLFPGTAKENLDQTGRQPLSTLRGAVKSPAWRETGARQSFLDEVGRLRYKVANEQHPTQADIANLIGRYYIDILRLSDDNQDLVPILANIHADDNMQKQVMLRDYLPYTGREKVMSGMNDSVPLIEEFLGNLTPVELEVRGFGHKTSLYQMVFNPAFAIDKVLQAAADIRSDERNNEVIAPIVGATYDAAHSQTFMTNPTFSPDINLYQTLRAAIRKARNLYSAIFPKQKLNTMQNMVYILCNPEDAPDIQYLASGALSNNGQGLGIILGSLGVNAIVPYAGGKQNGLPWGKTTLSFPGIPEGQAYVVVKNPFTVQYLQKRDTQLETGSGSVLQLSSEERAWYRITKCFPDWALPNTDSGTGNPVGAIVKIPSLS